MNLARRDEILEGALDLEPGQVDDFLVQQCGSDEELRAEVERLIHAHRRMQISFLDGPAAEWTTAALLPGQKLGRFVIENVIGIGGMSIVYLAKDAGIGRQVAIKVLTSEGIPAAGNVPYSAEVRMLGSIRHPNVVQIFDFGHLHGVPYIVMEYLDGEDLACIIASGKCGDFEWKLSVARQLASALSHVHSAGIIHRDIKPANVFVAPDGTVKLMDFGISRFDNTASTRTAAFVGTPEYLPPEHVKGERATNRSDIYSYGILLFELFTGEKAFSGNTAEVLYRVAHEDLPFDALRKHDIPRTLAVLIRAAVQKDPADRPPDFVHVSTILASVTGQEQIVNKSHFLAGHKSKVTAALAILSLGAISFVLLYVSRGFPFNPARSDASISSKNLKVLPPVTVQSSRDSHLKVAVPPSEPPLRVTPESVPGANKKRNLPSSDAFRGDVPDGRERVQETRSPSENQDSSIQLPFRTSPQTKLEIPGLSDTDSGTVAPAANSPEPVPPPAQRSVVPDIQSARTAAQHDVLLVLDRYAQAYGAKDIDGMSALFPSLTDMDRRKLALAFSVARDVNLKLTPQGEPQIEMRADGSPESAAVRCRRLIRMSPISGRVPRPLQDVCVFRLQHLPSGWRILSQQSN